MTDSPAGPSVDNATARLQATLARGWEPPGGHPLAALHGAPIGAYRLFVALGPKNAVGSRYFQAFLVDGEGRPADERFVLGLYNSGPYPGFNWVELTHYVSKPSWGGRAVDLAEGNHDLEFLRMISSLVPAGGHIMAEYDSPSQEETARILTLGYPPVTSPLGFRFFQAGCRSYRDWYIPEGGREGPRKLQAFKPWNEEIAREKTEALLAEVKRTVSDEPSSHGRWGEVARRNARAVLETLTRES